uniref:Reverse transcriptase domain-containing protein n=1 Tax=Tanacetum cinerariifolium TaxID=118510 RepID=A0A699ICE5_TANCI|nr:reverse transcriptase domain-containing protein [Tanacetum cinerariifolium]
MADNRTMEEILQAPTEGDVPNDVIKLMMFPYSLEENARVWYDKEPPISILTWEDLVNKFVNQFFPPSKTTHLKNEISSFTQRFEETFGEAWEQFKEMIRACPHHGFTKSAQIDTFYNGLNDNDQDSLNAAAGGNILSKTTREALQIIENKSKVRYSRNKPNVSRMNTNSKDNASKSDDRTDKLTDQIATLVDIFAKKIVAPARLKRLRNLVLLVENQSSTLGTLSSNTIPNPKGEKKAITTRSGVAYEGPSIPTPKKVAEQETEETTDKEQSNFQGSTARIQPPVTLISEPDVPKTLPKPSIPYPLRLNDQKLREKATNQMEKFFQIFQDLHFDISFADALLLMPKFASTIKSLLTNKDKLFELANIPLNENCSAMLLKKLLEKLGDPGKFLIPCDFLGMDISLPELTPTRMTLELADRSITRPKGVAKDVFVKVEKFHFLIDFVVVDFEAGPRVPLILGRSFLRTGRALIDVYGEEITLWVNDESVTFNLNQTTRYSSTYDDLSINRIDIIDVAREEYAQEFLGFSNNFLVGNLTSTFEPILSDSSLFYTLFEGSDFILEEIDAYLKDELVSLETNHAYCDPEGDICLIEKLLNDDPFQLPSMDFKQGEVVKAKSSIEEPPELELKELPSHLEYAYLEGVDKLPVIISKDLKVDEKEALLKVLKSHKRAIAWKITNIKGIDPRFCTHKILMEEDYKPDVQSQRWVNPKIHEVIKKEVIKLLDAGMIYLISNSPWVSPIHCVPKKGGITIVENENNELIPTRLVTGWRVYIDYRKLNDATRKDHFPLLFMDQMCMMAIFHDMIEKTMEVFMDDFSVVEDSFSSCLSHLDTMLQRFIQDFSKISKPMTHLLEKETPFLFSKDCIDAFETLKKKLIEAPILVVLDWNLPFELMCDASNFAIGTVLGQRKTKHFQSIHYASKTMTEAQIHYTATEQEMLVVVYAFEKFRPYLVLSKSIVYTDNSALKYILRTENLAADHLSRLENPHKDVFENKDINKNFPLETLVKISSGSTPWFADFANFHAGNFIVKGMSSQQKKKFFKDVKHYLWDDPTFFEYVQIKSFDGVCMAKKLLISSKLVMKEPPGAIMVPISSPRKTTYKTPIGCTPYKLVYGKSCHLPIELEHKAYWALKHVNFDLKIAGDHRKLQLNELNELHDQAYENFLIYKEKTKKIHDSKIKNRIFNVGDRVLLFNSRLKIFARKLKTRWSGPFTITKVFPYGTVELSQTDGPNFKVNGHRVKHYFGGDVPQLVVPDLQTFPMDK